jgi:hypothetical protein
VYLEETILEGIAQRATSIKSVSLVDVALLLVVVAYRRLG